MVEGNVRRFRSKVFEGSGKLPAACLFAFVYFAFVYIDCQYRQLFTCLTKRLASVNNGRPLSLKTGCVYVSMRGDAGDDLARWPIGVTLTKKYVVPYNCSYKRDCSPG